MGGEGCDDGALNGMAGQCSVTCSPPGCGDGTYDPATEFCDAGMTGTNTCADFGYLGGTLGCTAMCGPDVSGCNNCGNGIIDGVEDCDGAALGGGTCMTVTGGPGTLGCNPDCTYDTSGCAGCGNGMIEGTEECDGLNLGGNDCTTIPGGYSGGTLSCNSMCMFDAGSCTGGACDPTSPPIYMSAPVISYMCTDFFGMVGVDIYITDWVFSTGGTGMLNVGPIPTGPTPLVGAPTSCPSGSFTVEKVVPGGCCEHYTLTGTYTGPDTWSGTFTADYCESASCGCYDGGPLCPGPCPPPGGCGCGDGLSCDFFDDGTGSCYGGMWPVTGTR
jgi:hypothetical protein